MSIDSEEFDQVSALKAVLICGTLGYAAFVAIPVAMVAGFLAEFAFQAGVAKGDVSDVTFAVHVLLTMFFVVAAELPDDTRMKMAWIEDGAGAAWRMGVSRLAHRNRRFPLHEFLFPDVELLQAARRRFTLQGVLAGLFLFAVAAEFAVLPALGMEGEGKLTP